MILIPALRIETMPLVLGTQRLNHQGWGRGMWVLSERKEGRVRKGAGGDTRLDNW